MFMSMLGLPPGGEEARANDKGEFTYRQVKEGTYQLVAQAEDYSGNITDSNPITVIVGDGGATGEDPTTTGDSVADSPVVPTATTAPVPSRACIARSVSRLSQSTAPSSCMGVTRATILPLIM